MQYKRYMHRSGYVSDGKIAKFANVELFIDDEALFRYMLNRATHTKRKSRKRVAFQVCRAIKCSITYKEGE